MVIEERTGLAGLRVEHWSASVNVYHCCMYKTASQWVKAILSHPRIYRYSGLLFHQYERELPGAFDPRAISRRFFHRPFPPHTIAGPLYLDFASYDTIPKPERYSAFFVIRDPRDIVISSYFSGMYSHELVGGISGLRNVLREVSEPEGLVITIDALNKTGQFDALRSWNTLSVGDACVRLIKFEDLTGPASLSTWQRLLDHCDIAMPESGLSELLDDYSFQRLSGRKQGQEDTQSHYRKGIAGDWRNHFDPTVERHFRDVTNDLAADLSYPD
jgi:hypothetical protein